MIIRAYETATSTRRKKDKDVFAINVLKTLFMVKYVLEIEANIDNITSLMIENIDDDRIELKGRVEGAEGPDAADARSEKTAASMSS